MRKGKHHFPNSCKKVNNTKIHVPLTHRRIDDHCIKFPAAIVICKLSLKLWQKSRRYIPKVPIIREKRFITLNGITTVFRGPRAVLFFGRFVPCFFGVDNYYDRQKQTLPNR